MKNRYRIGILATLLCTTATLGCCTFRGAKQEANVAAARDLTFHGMNALHQGHAGRAESLLHQAVEACPEDQRIRQQLANAMVRQGKIDTAIQQLETAIEHSHNDPRLFVELGNLHLLKQQPREALGYAVAALQLNRQDPNAWILRGRCQQVQGAQEAALASFHRAAALNDVSPAVQVHIAQAYQELQRPMQALTALEAYNEDFAADQVPMEAVLLTSKILIDLNQSDRAAKQLAAASKRSDATADTWLALSQIQNENGDTSTALLTARNAMSVFPDDPKIQTWTTSLVERAGQSSPTGQTAGLPRATPY